MNTYVIWSDGGVFMGTFRSSDMEGALAALDKDAGAPPYDYELRWSHGPWCVASVEGEGEFPGEPGRREDIWLIADEDDLDAEEDDLDADEDDPEAPQRGRGWSFSPQEGLDIDPGFPRSRGEE